MTARHHSAGVGVDRCPRRSFWCITFLHLTLVAAVGAALAAMLPFGTCATRATTNAQIRGAVPRGDRSAVARASGGTCVHDRPEMVAEELPDPIGPEFQTALRPAELRACHSRRRSRTSPIGSPLLDARFFVTAVLTQKGGGRKPFGGSRQSRAIIRDRFKVKRQVRVISAHGRITGWVLSALPTALGAVLLLHEPGEIRDFLHVIRSGCSMIGGALFLQLIGVFIIKKIVKIEYRGQHVTANLRLSSLPSSSRSPSPSGLAASLICQVEHTGAPRDPQAGASGWQRVFAKTELTEVASPWVKRFSRSRRSLRRKCRSSAGG